MTPRLQETRAGTFVPRRTFTPDFWYFSASAVVLVFTSVVFLLCAPAEHRFGIDFWEHVSCVRQLMTDPIHPLHPQYATHDTSRQYMPWFLVLAIFGRIAGLDPLRVMALDSILTTVLLLFGIRLFFRDYFENPWAPLGGLLCLFFLWGNPWVWSAFYNFRSYLTTAAYPSSFVFGLSFIIWWMGLRAVRRTSLRRWEPPLLAGLVAVAFLVHQLSGLFALATFICFVAAAPGGPWRRKLALVLVALLGVVPTFAWPYFNPWRMVIADQVWNPLWVPSGAARFYQPSEVLKCIGPALVGIPAFIAFVRMRINAALVLGFTGALLVYVVGGVLGNPMSHRVLIVVILYLHLGLTWLLLMLAAGPDGMHISRWKLVAAFVGPFTLAQLGAASLELASMAFPHSVPRRILDRGYIDVVASFRVIGSYLSDRSVTMATVGASKVVPAFRGRVVSVYWTSPLAPDDDQRGRDSERFFAAATSVRERREIMQRYGVTHVLYEVDVVAPETASMLHDIADEKIVVNGLVLMKIRL